MITYLKGSLFTFTHLCLLQKKMPDKFSSWIHFTNKKCWFYHTPFKRRKSFTFGDKMCCVLYITSDFGSRARSKINTRALTLKSLSLLILKPLEPTDLSLVENRIIICMFGFCVRIRELQQKRSICSIEMWWPVLQ